MLGLCIVVVSGRAGARTAATYGNAAMSPCHSCMMLLLLDRLLTTSASAAAGAHGPTHLDARIEAFLGAYQKTLAEMGGCCRVAGDAEVSLFCGGVQAGMPCCLQVQRRHGYVCRTPCTDPAGCNLHPSCVSHLRAYPPAGEEEFEKQRQALLALKMMKVRRGVLWALRLLRGGCCAGSAALGCRRSGSGWRMLAGSAVRATVALLPLPTLCLAW